MGLSYYWGAIILTLGIIILYVRNEYFGVGIILSLAGFYICSYYYKKMERDAQAHKSVGDKNG